jgi:hypothetical protein
MTDENNQVCEGCSSVTEESKARSNDNSNKATNFNGTWICPGRGQLSISQKGNRVTGGSFRGRNGEEWREPNSGILAVSKKANVNGSTTTFLLVAYNYKYSPPTQTVIGRVKATIDSSETKFSGTWEKYIGNNQYQKSTDVISCHR